MPLTAASGKPPTTNLTTMKTYLPEGTSKKQALAALRDAKTTRPASRLFEEGGIYCQPGKGLASFSRFFIV